MKVSPDLEAKILAMPNVKIGKRDNRQPLPPRVAIPCQVVSEANMRECWQAKHRRKKAQQEATWFALSEYKPPAGPLTITLTRFGKTMDTDNLAGSFKAVRDAIAKWLGRDDGDESLTWLYAQEGGKGAVVCEIRLA